MNAKTIGVIHPVTIHEVLIARSLKSEGYEVVVGRKAVSMALGKIDALVAGTLDFRTEVFSMFRVIVIGEFNADLVMFAETCGARGFVSAFEKPEAIVEAIEADMSPVYFSPGVIEILENSEPREEIELEAKLNQFDMDVFKLLSNTHKGPRIAKLLRVNKQRVYRSINKIIAVVNEEDLDELQLISRNLLGRVQPVNEDETILTNRYARDIR